MRSYRNRKRVHKEQAPAPPKKSKGFPRQWPPNNEQFKAISSFFLNLAVIAFAALGATVWSNDKLHIDAIPTLLLYAGGGVMFLVAALCLLYDIDDEEN